MYRKQLYHIFHNEKLFSTHYFHAILPVPFQLHYKKMRCANKKIYHQGNQLYTIRNTTGEKIMDEEEKAKVKMV